MKIICTQSELSKHLTISARAVSSRPTHPVLANILLYADRETQTIQITGFDLSIGIETGFEATIEEGGAITLPSKLLGDIVSRLPDGTLTLETTGEELLLTLTAATGSYQIRGMSSTEFPTLPDIDSDQATWTVPSQYLTEGVRGSLFAASLDETKQVLCGVRITHQVDGLEFAATDGHRLSVTHPLFEMELNDDTSPGLEATVPAKALQELQRLLVAYPESSIQIQTDPSQITFECGSQRLVSRLLEGTYPNYEQLLPRQFTHQVTVDRRSFLSALERISVLADQKNNIVRFVSDPEAQAMILSVDAQDVGNGRETISAQISGEELQIAFNIKYIVEGLRAISTPEVQMQFNTSTAPAVIGPHGGPKHRYLVMPVQLRAG